MFARRAFFLAAFLAVSSMSLAAQDTRVVTEPTIPAVCRTLKARYSSAALDIADQACAKSADACDTARIQHAIDACSAAAVEANTRLAVALESDASDNAFLIQPLHIKTGVTLLLRRGVTAYASMNPRDYDTTPGRCGTIDSRGHGCHPLIAIDNASNAGLMGAGAIDGRGYHRLLNGTQSWWQIARAADVPGLKQNCPRLIIADHADGLTLYKITLRNSPNFHVAVNHTNGFTAWGVIIDTPKSARNTDGIDPGTSRNITITHSFIRTGDDNVAIKGGVSNITVSHDYFYEGHGISIGSGATPPVTNVLVSGLSLQNTANGIRIKSDISRGGLVDGAVYENICMKNVQVPIAIDPFYNQTPIDPFTDPGIQGDRIPVDKNIVLRNIHSVTAQPILIAGWDSAHPVGITLDGVSIDGIHAGDVHLQFDKITIGPRGENFSLRGKGVVVEGREPSRVIVTSCAGRFPSFPESQ
ncbi:MAG TPA: glycosyl hydrolase family 28 protein [Acidobacteriaceae bacterium]|nr:glycosyl hydrolase family 28 protein [Acidobacteriaceae bacterium]